MTSSIVTRSQSKRLSEDDLPKPKRNELDGMVEMLRDQAFSEAHQMVMPEIARSFEAKLLDKKLPTVSRTHDQIVEEIALKKSIDAACALKELYHILESSSYTRHYINCISDFALELINQLPDKIEDDVEASEQAVDYAKSLKERLPFDLPEEVIANAFQKAIDGKQEPEMTDQEEEIIKHLGTLLLVAQRDIKVVYEAVQQESIEETLACLNDYQEHLFEKAEEAMQSHYQAHKKTKIQGEKEALIHKMSLEMADLLLLDTGSINIGIIETVMETLVPEELQDIEAIKNLNLVLKELMDTSLVGDLLAHATPPKNPDLPSNGLIRACLGLSPKEIITKRHVQLVALSALLGHMRQAKAGTCFATAWIIKAFYNHLPIVTADFIELLQEGQLTRVHLKEERNYPIQLRLSKEYLDTEIFCDRQGRITKIERFARDNLEINLEVEKDAFIYDSPGLLSVCRALNISNPKEAMLNSLSEMTQPISPKEIIFALAKQAFANQESQPFYLRSTEKLTLEQIIERGQYAYGAETNHPLHRAYEQTIACSVNYFGSQYLWGAWLHCSFKETLEHMDKGYPPAFQYKYRDLIKEMFLPILTRARFIYNHHIDDYEPLFNAKTRECKAHSGYGYELKISPLPSDFKYSQELYKEYQNEVSYFHPVHFKGYSPATTWKKIESAEDYINFLIEVLEDAVAYKKSKCPQEVHALWEQVAQKMKKDIRNPKFIRSVIINIFGRGQSQKKHFIKNEHHLSTLPWKFRWGGDPNAVIKAYFGFSKAPSKTHKFNGSPLEVLAKTIHHIKEMPEEIRETLEDPKNPFVISSPRHAFLLTPSETSFQEAIDSTLDPIDYIKREVIAPGAAIAEKPINEKTREELIQFVYENKWFHPSIERHDYERQELTSQSKLSFDDLIEEHQEIWALPQEEFIKMLVKLTGEARALDERIAKRNSMWEAKCLTAFKNKWNELQDKNELVAFARNRKDTQAFLENGKKRFLEAANQIPKKLSIKEFRQALVQAAVQAHESDLCFRDKKWKGTFCEKLDSKLFTLLPKKWQQECLLNGIITHDMNWKQEVHNYLGIFMVNPATGKLELASYLPDLDKVCFMEQGDWFGKKGRWEFPQNYLAYKDRPLFNYKKLLGVD